MTDSSKQDDEQVTSRKGASPDEVEERRHREHFANFMAESTRRLARPERSGAE